MSALYRPSPIATVLWAVVVLFGFGAAWRYEATQGPDSPLAQPPHASEGGPYRIEMFVHPSCPCSRASLTNLAGWVRSHPGGATVRVVVVGDHGRSGNLDRSSNAEAARRIPGAEVAMDPKGSEARNRGAQTSGQTFAFSPKGVPLFQGGLTAGRGHEGMSAGLDALTSIVQGQSPRSASSPVFGCPLFSEENAR